MTALRTYQIRAIDQLRAAYASGKRAPCLVLPTGAGKTVVAAEVIRQATERGRSVLFCVHRVELVRQSVAKLRAAGINPGVIQAGTDETPCNQVVVASIQTLASKRWRDNPDRMPEGQYVIFDEVHHLAAKTWAAIARHYERSFLLGLTATPQRADGKPLGDLLDSIVVGSTVRELTDLGHLVPCRVLSPPEMLDRAETAVAPLEAYRRHGGGGKCVVFCVTVEHAQAVAAEFGGQAAVIHGGMPAKQRAETLARFGTGEIRVLCNVFVLTEGWDDPSVEVIILTRRPSHAGTFLQIAGRALRPSPGKVRAILIDLCGSVLVHGHPATERQYTLDGDGIRRADTEQIRQCQLCGGVWPANQARDGVCPSCGEELPRKPVPLPRLMGAALAEYREGQRVLGDKLLRQNLEAAAQGGAHSAAWVEAAHQKIATAKLRWGR